LVVVVDPMRPTMTARLTSGFPRQLEPMFDLRRRRWWLSVVHAVPLDPLSARVACTPALPRTAPVRISRRDRTVFLNREACRFVRAYGLNEDGFIAHEESGR
jgi:hypothetical protein